VAAFLSFPNIQLLTTFFVFRSPLAFLMHMPGCGAADADPPSKFEQNTARAAAAEKHSLSAKSAGQP
jgi:hypothetical protein